MSSKTKNSGSLLDFLASEKGKIIINYLYGFGAAIVILGALFKIMHWPGAGPMLITGMGTEVLLFVIGAFEKPHKDPEWHHVFPVLATGDPNDNPLLNGIPTQGGVVGQSTVVAASTPLSPELNMQLEESVKVLSLAAHQLSKTAIITTNLDSYVESVNSVVSSMKTWEKSAESISSVSVELADRYSKIDAHEAAVKKNNEQYLEKMTTLNDNVQGLNSLYLEQMKSVMAQIESINKLHVEITRIGSLYQGSVAETAKFKEESAMMTKQLMELNTIYAKMLKAMNA